MDKTLQKYSGLGFESILGTNKSASQGGIGWAKKREI